MKLRNIPEHEFFYKTIMSRLDRAIEGKLKSPQTTTVELTG
jgi:hypothetical protein